LLVLLTMLLNGTALGQTDDNSLQNHLIFQHPVLILYLTTNAYDE